MLQPGEVVGQVGISGIRAGYWLKRSLPERTFATRGARGIGGTSDLLRYPGIRSDSGQHTFGYEFKPWNAPARSFRIATSAHRPYE